MQLRPLQGLITRIKINYDAYDSSSKREGEIQDKANQKSRLYAVRHDIRTKNFVVRARERVCEWKKSVIAGYMRPDKSQELASPLLTSPAVPSRSKHPVSLIARSRCIAVHPAYSLISAIIRHKRRHTGMSWRQTSARAEVVWVVLLHTCTRVRRAIRREIPASWHCERSTHALWPRLFWILTICIKHPCCRSR